MTQIKRSDDPAGYAMEHGIVQAAFASPAPQTPPRRCEAGTPGGTTAYCLTRMMDCRKPSGGFKDNIKGNVMTPGKKLVQPCLRDGYTRIDVQCGCFDCYC
jgi:hypothetical protein